MKKKQGHRKGGIMKLKLISSLLKVYDNDGMPEKGLKSFSLLKNEKKSFQVAIEGEGKTKTAQPYTANSVFHLNPISAQPLSAFMQ